MRHAHMDGQLGLSGSGIRAAMLFVERSVVEHMSGMQRVSDAIPDTAS